MIKKQRQSQTMGNRSRGRILGNRRGSTMILVMVAIVAMFAFAVLAIDGAILMTARTQLHAAADAAALAGASGILAGSQSVAVDRAINFASYNSAVRQTMSPVVITADDVSFPEPDVIRVKTHRTVATGDALTMYFLRVIDPLSANTADMTAVASAKVYDVCGSRCLKPWAIPDRWDDSDKDGAYDAGEYYDPDMTGYRAPLDVGKSIVIKVGDPKNTIAPGVFFPVNYPPLDKYEGEKPKAGGAWYRTFIRECEPYLVEPGDRLQIEPGNMVGPTLHGVRELIAQDLNAEWDATTKTIINSDYGLSPRVVLVPFLDPTQPPTQGRDWVTVIKLGAFFVEGTGPGNEVNARFIKISVHGIPCPGGVGSSFIKSIALVE